MEVAQTNGVDSVIEVGPASAVISFGARTGARLLKRPSQLGHPSLTIISLREVQQSKGGERSSPFVLPRNGETNGVSNSIGECMLSRRPDNCNKKSRLRNGHTANSLTPVFGEQRQERGSRASDGKPTPGLGRQANVGVIHEEEPVGQSTETSTNEPEQSTSSFEPLNVRLATQGTIKLANGDLPKKLFDHMQYAEFEHSKFRRRPLK